MPKINYEFLRRVWEAQPKGSHLFLCAKVGFTTRTQSKTGNYKLDGDWVERSFTSIDEAIDWLKAQPARTDLYWCPTWFNGPKRKKELVTGSRFLWADLDEANPNQFDESLKPSVVWESSPERFQGLWELDTDITPKQAEDGNKAVAYALAEFGADKGGWDLSQVLRIPGARNHKYGKEWGDKKDAYSKLLWFEDHPQPLSKLKLAAGMKGASDLPSDVATYQPTENVEADFAAVLTKYRKKLSSKTVGLLLQDEAEEGRRSDILWYLNHALLEAGMSVEESVALIKGSVWNKYSGQAREHDMLIHEAMKALEKVVIGSGYDLDGTEAKKKDPKEERQKAKNELQESYVELATSFKLVSDTQLMQSSNSQPGWLVKGFWTKSSNGIVAGQPKSFKSTLTMDLMVSVASGEPFLGSFPVEQQGPVLLIQNENADWIMKDRLEKIREAKGLSGEEPVVINGQLRIDFPPELPIHYINQQGFNLQSDVHRKLLNELMDEIQPVLLILDPLYLMFGGDLNSAKELNPILSWLIDLKNRHACSLIVVHHYNKGGADKRGGQRMLGSATLHGWTESAWYIETRNAPDEEHEEGDDFDALKPTGKAEVVIEREFRGAGMHPKVDLAIEMGGHGDRTYKIDVARHKPLKKEPGQKGGKKKDSAAEEPKYEDIRDQIVTALEMTTHPITLDLMAKTIGIGAKHIQRFLNQMHDELLITKTPGGWILNDD